MSTYYIKQDAAVVPGKAVVVYERSAEGMLLGIYTGYYNVAKGNFTLYPAATFPHIKPKHVVDASLVRRGRV